MNNAYKSPASYDWWSFSDYFDVARLGQALKYLRFSRSVRVMLHLRKTGEARILTGWEGESSVGMSDCNCETVASQWENCRGPF